MFFGCVVVLKNHSCAPKHAARTAPQKINFASSKRSAQGANQKLDPRPNTKRFWGGSCLIAVDHGEAAWFLLLGHCFDSCCWLGKGCKKNMARDPKHKKTLDQHPALTHVVRAPCVHIVWGTIPNLVGKKSKSLALVTRVVYYWGSFPTTILWLLRNGWTSQT